MDGEDDSGGGGLLLDGGQEGELTPAPEELHHPVGDGGRRVDGSAHIWGGGEGNGEETVRA